MKKYVIQATITKVIEAASEEEAHELFSSRPDEYEEIYDQETIAIQ